MLSDAGLWHPSLRGPSALLEETLMIEGAGTAVLRRRVVHVQTKLPETTLPEAGGQVGVEPAAVSQEWLSGAPCSLAARAEHENSCCDRLGTTLLGVFQAPGAGGTTCLLGTQKI